MTMCAEPPKPYKPQPAARRWYVGEAKGPVADYTGTEQGHCLEVWEGVGDREGEGLVAEEVVGIAARRRCSR